MEATANDHTPGSNCELHPLPMGWRTPAEAVYNVGRLWVLYNWHFKQEFLLKAVADSCGGEDLNPMLLSRNVPDYYVTVLSALSTAVRRSAALQGESRKLVLAGMHETNGLNYPKLMNAIGQLGRLDKYTYAANVDEFRSSFDDCIGQCRQATQYESTTLARTEFIDRWITTPVYARGVEILIDEIAPDLRLPLRAGLAIQTLICPSDVCEHMCSNRTGTDWSLLIEPSDSITDEQVGEVRDWICQQNDNPLQVAWTPCKIGSRGFTTDNVIAMGSILTEASLSDAAKNWTMTTRSLHQLHDRKEAVTRLHGALSNWCKSYVTEVPGLGGVRQHQWGDVMFDTIGNEISARGKKEE